MDWPELQRKTQLVGNAQALQGYSSGFSAVTNQDGWRVGLPRRTLGNWVMAARRGCHEPVLGARTSAELKAEPAKMREEPAQARQEPGIVSEVVVRLTRELFLAACGYTSIRTTCNSQLPGAIGFARRLPGPAWTRDSVR